MRDRRLWACAVLLTWGLCTAAVRGGSAFIEAETFTTTDGWQVLTGDRAKTASGLALLDGSRGKRDGVATGTVTLKDAGRYFIWVRYLSHPKYRGPFKVTALAGGRE